MLNAPVAASDTALPEINRRAFLSKTVAGAATGAFATGVGLPDLTFAAENPENMPVTLEWLAAREFEPWKDEADSFLPLTNKEWIEEINPTLVTVRLAHLALLKTKGELVDVVKEMGDEYFESFMDGIENATNFFKAHIEMLEASHARLMSAAACVALHAGSA